MDINVSTLRGVYTSLSTAFNARFATVQSMYGMIAMTVPSTTAQNEYPRLDDLPGIREWIGERHVHRLSAQTYLIRNREFEGTIAILRKQMEDDQIGLFAPVAGQMGQDAAAFPDTLIWPLLANGHLTECYDGQYFFDTDHLGFDATGAQISVSNYTAGAGPAWYLIDDTQVVKPLVYQPRKAFKLTQFFDDKDPNVFWRNEYVWGVDGRMNAGYGLWQLAYKSMATLNEANLLAAREAMMGLRKRSGEKIAIKPTKLLVPTSLGSTARKLLNAELINGGESNTLKGLVEVVEVPFL
jgi:phage major head subunit gpT-like protein